MSRFLPAAIFLIGASPAIAAPTTISGSPGIVDGDTIRISGTRIRLQGIDAPEKEQSCFHVDGSPWACGQESARRLQAFIAGRQVLCQSSETDRYGRSLATCFVDGKDLGAWMVSSGWAVAYTHYSQRYVPEENRAKKSNLGIWNSQFTMPWQWRAENR